MLALLERNTRKVGLAHNLGEDRVWEDLQELVGIERHRSITRDMSLSGRGGLFGERYLERTGHVCRVGGHGRESLGCRYRGLFWDGAERRAELGGWDVY